MTKQTTTEAQLREWAEAGESARLIAKRLGANKTYVVGACVVLGIKLNGRSGPAITVDPAIYLDGLSRGLTLKEVAAEHNKSVATVNRQLCAAGLSTPPEQPPVHSGSSVGQTVSGWQPIETAYGNYILLSNGAGAWIARWAPISASGYRWENPWRSCMLSHDHIPLEERYRPATHWMPIPTVPMEGEGSKNG